MERASGTLLVALVGQVLANRQDAQPKLFLLFSDIPGHDLRICRTQALKIVTRDAWPRCVNPLAQMPPKTGDSDRQKKITTTPQLPLSPARTAPALQNQTLQHPSTQAVQLRCMSELQQPLRQKHQARNLSPTSAFWRT